MRRAHGQLTVVVDAKDLIVSYIKIITSTVFLCLLDMTFLVFCP